MAAAFVVVVDAVDVSSWLWLLMLVMCSSLSLLALHVTAAAVCKRAEARPRASLPRKLVRTAGAFFSPQPTAGLPSVFEKHVLQYEYLPPSCRFFFYFIPPHLAPAGINYIQHLATFTSAIPPPLDADAAAIILHDNHLTSKPISKRYLYSNSVRLPISNSTNTPTSTIRSCAHKNSARK